MAQDEYVVYHSKPKLAALTVCMGLFAVGIPPYTIRGAYQHHTAGPDLWVALAVLELILVPLLYKATHVLASTPPALIINQNGVFENVAIGGASGWIPWENIARIEITNSGMMHTLGITPYNQAALLKGKSLFTRLNMLSRKLMPGSAPVGIIDVTLPVKIEDIYAEMQRRQPVEDFNGVRSRVEINEQTD